MKEWLEHPTTSTIRKIISNHNARGNILSVGSSPQKKDILNLPYFNRDSDQFVRIGINIGGRFGKFNGFEVIEANGHNIPFNDEYFDLVICNSMLEHDVEFWKTISEVKRVLKKKGLFIASSPGYAKISSKIDQATYVYEIHGDDYYRFSEQSFREFIFSGFEEVSVTAVMNPPRIIGCGLKV